MVEQNTVTLELHPRDRSFRSNLGLLSMSGAVKHWRVYLVHTGGYTIPDVVHVENAPRAGFIIVKTKEQTLMLQGSRQILLITAVVQVQPKEQK